MCIKAWNKQDSRLLHRSNVQSVVSVNHRLCHRLQWNNARLTSCWILHWAHMLLLIQRGDLRHGSNQPKVWWGAGCMFITTGCGCIMHVSAAAAHANAAPCPRPVAAAARLQSAWNHALLQLILQVGEVALIRIRFADFRPALFTGGRFDARGTWLVFCGSVVSRQTLEKTKSFYKF